MKKNFFKTLLNGVIMGTVALIIICVGFYIFIKARSDIKTTTDTEPDKLYVNEGETLTATKRNSLVDKKGLKDLTIIDCYSASSSRGGGGRKDIPWIPSLCGGNLPTNYDKCYYAAKISVGDNGSFYCYINKGRTYSTTAYNSISCSYLCRNE